MADNLTTPYASAVAFITNALPSWVSSEYERQRLGSYDLYDDMFENALGQFRILLRGTDDYPVLVPTAKKLVNTMCRYVGRDWGVSIVAGADETGKKTDAKTVTLAMTTIGDFMEREAMLSKFEMGKEEWLRRGDWLWMLSADPAKPALSRISIQLVDPRTYFPIIESDVVPGGSQDRVVGQTIAETVYGGADNKTQFVKVQRWIKASHPEHPNYVEPDQEAVAPDTAFDIYYDSVRYEMTGWDSPDPKKRKVAEVYATLEPIPGITQLPIYHIRDNPQTGNPYGRSNFAGFEAIFAAINQAVSDEDLALAMAGLGMWWTDAGAPLDENNKPTNWIIGPQRVAEVPQGSKFGRLSGITSVEPQQTHIKYLEDQVFGAQGINDIALGRATVQESGIALAIRMQPLFDAAKKKNGFIDTDMNHLLYDLKQWFLVYESIDLGSVDIKSTSSLQLLPFDRDAYFQELAAGYAAKWFSLEYVWKELSEKLGYEINPSELKKQLDEAAKSAAALADPYAKRAGDELNDPANQDDPNAGDQTGA